MENLTFLLQIIDTLLSIALKVYDKILERKK